MMQKRRKTYKITPMEKILVSACLLGDKTRYDGKDNFFPFIRTLNQKYDIIPFCPEVEGGLPIPREPGEIKGASIVTKDGKDLTKFYQEGAKKALALCLYFNIKIAILKDRSPSCGSRFIHDGNFSNKLIDGTGITARLLIAHGIKVYCENDNLEFLLKEPKSSFSSLRKTSRRSPDDKKTLNKKNR